MLEYYFLHRKKTLKNSQMRKGEFFREIKQIKDHLAVSQGTQPYVL